MAVIVILGVHAIMYMLHAVEVKLNKLLDHHGIMVTDADISKDRGGR